MLREGEGSRRAEEDGLIYRAGLSASPPGSIHYSSSCGKKSSPGPQQIRAAAAAVAGAGRGAFSARVRTRAWDWGQRQAPEEDTALLGPTCSHLSSGLFLASFPGESGGGFGNARQWGLCRGWRARQPAPSRELCQVCIIPGKSSWSGACAAFFKQGITCRTVSLFYVCVCMQT